MDIFLYKMTDTQPIQPENNNAKPPTRARKYSKVPSTLTNPDGSIIHLTKKMRSVIRRIPSANKLRDIADDLNCSPGTVYNTFKLPAVQAYLRQQLEAAGATHGKIFQRIAEGLDATKGKDKFNVERPDYGERRESAKLALRLQGLDTPPAEEKESTITNNSIYNIVIQARQARGIEGAKPVNPANLSNPGPKGLQNEGSAATGDADNSK